MTKVSSGTLTVVVFAIIAGLAGAYVVRQQLQQAPAPLPEIEAQNRTVIVPVAAIDLKSGQRLTVNDIALLRFSPEEYAQSEYVNQSYMRNSSQIQDRVLKVAVERGEAFLPTSFYPDGAGPGIAELLEEGYRAVTIPIEHISAVQGFARPGSMVDVLFRSRKEEDRPEVTITLLEHVEVLAVNTNTLSEKSVELDKDGAVTLAVTPNQAKALKVVEGRGELSLTLRNPNDDMDFLPVDLNRGENMRGIADGGQPEEGGVHPVNQPGAPNKRGRTAWWRGMEHVVQGGDQVSLNDLLNIPPKPKPSQMVIYRGGQREVIRFDEESASQADREPQMIRVPVEEEPYVRGRNRDRRNDPSVETVQFDNVSTTGAGG